MGSFVRTCNRFLALAIGLASCAALADEALTNPAGAEGGAPRGDFVSFYERAAARAAEGGGADRDVVRYRALARYKIECSVRLQSGNRNYFTVASTDDHRAVLFVWTDDGPVTSLQKAIRVGTYSAMLSKIPPDRQEGSLDWGWMYDRNGDGLVDYFTYLDGPNPVMTDEIAGLVPKKPGAATGAPIKIESKDELVLTVMNVQLVFTHHADDDFDGRSDAVVTSLRYPENPIWYYRSAVLRSRGFTQVIDDDWAFASDIHVKAGPVPREGGRARVQFFSSGEAALEISSKYLARINDGVRACHLAAGTLPRE